MKFETSSAGYDLTFTAPDTVEEYDRLAGPGQCLRDAVAETAERSTKLAWQSEFAKILEARTGIKREIDEEATAKYKARSKNPDKTAPVMERFSAYDRKVNEQYLKNGNTREQLQAWAQEVADKLPVDPTRQRIGPIAKGDLLKAENILSGTPESIDQKVEKYLEVVEDFNLVRDDTGLPEKNSLARLVGKYVAALL